MTTPQDLDERFRDAVAALTAGDRRATGRGTGPGRHRPRPARPRGRCSTPSSPAGTSTSPPAGCAASARAYYTIGSAGHEGNAAVAAALRHDRPGVAALPLRRVLLRPRRPGGRGHGRHRPDRRRRPRRAARHGRLGARADRRRPAQGVRQRRPAGRPDHLDDRLAPAARGRRRVRDRAAPAGSTAGGDAAWPADAIVVCSFGDASVNHASATAAFNTAGWCDHTGLRAAGAVRLRGQRAGHQRALARGLGRRGAAVPAGDPLLRGGRHRPRRGVRRRASRPPPTYAGSAGPPCCTCRPCG